MGFDPPPLPLSAAEYKRRVAAGAKTLEEIDIELAGWRRRRLIALWCEVAIAAMVGVGLVLSGYL